MLNAESIRNRIRLEFENRPLANEIDDAILSIIEKIGIELKSETELLTVSGDADYIISNLSSANDIAIISNLSSANSYPIISEFGKFIFGWEFDSDDKCLIVPSNVIDVLNVFVDDVEWSSETYENVQDDDYTDVYCFSQYYRKIYFPVDFGASTNTSTIKIAVVRSKEWISENDSIDLPDIYKQYLVSGAIVTLAARNRNIISEASLSRSVNEYSRLERYLFAHADSIVGTGRINVSLADEIY